MFETIVLAKREGIYTLTLNQPRNRNALSHRLADEFREAVETVRSDPETRFLILTGSGEAFCSGGDFDTIIADFSMPAADLKPRLREFYGKFLGLRDVPAPTLAAVNGHAVGAGFALALACDMRLASTKASFFANFLRIGVHPGMGTSYLLPRAVGIAKAMEILLMPEPISATRSLSLGLVSRVVEPEALMGEAMAVAGRIAAMPQLAVRLIKRSVHMGMVEDLEPMLEFESFAQALCAETEEMKQAVAAFQRKKEKDRPESQGQ